MIVYNWLFRSDLPNIIQVTSGVLLLYALRKFNCNEKRCLRIGTHKVEGTTYRTCHKHTTIPVHARLIGRHSEKRPEAHRLLNKNIPS